MKYDEEFHLLSGFDSAEAAAQCLSTMSSEQVTNIIKYLNISLASNAQIYSHELLGKIIMLELKKQSKLISYELMRLQSGETKFSEMSDRLKRVSDFMYQVVSMNAERL